MDGENFMENPIKLDDLGISLFLETPIYHIVDYTTQLYRDYNKPLDPGSRS